MVQGVHRCPFGGYPFNILNKKFITFFMKLEPIGHSGGVRREDYIVQLPQRAFGRQRLGFKNIQAGAGDFF